MLAVPIYYVFYASILIAIAIGLFKIWDRQQSNKVIPFLNDPAWLPPANLSLSEPSEKTQQDLYDFSLQYISYLKGVLASPTPNKLEKLGELISSDENLYRELWPDIEVRVAYVYESYKVEFSALIEAISKNSNHPVSLYAAYQLSKCVPVPTSRLKQLTLEIGKSPIIKPAIAAAKKRQCTAPGQLTDR